MLKHGGLQRFERFYYALHQVVGLGHSGPGGIDSARLRLEVQLELMHIGGNVIMQRVKLFAEALQARFNLGGEGFGRRHRILFQESYALIQAVNAALCVRRDQQVTSTYDVVGSIC